MDVQEKQKGLLLLGVTSVVIGDKITIDENAKKTYTDKEILKAIQDDNQKKENAKQTALAKLTAIGLTPEDLTALGIAV